MHTSSTLLQFQAMQATCLMESSTMPTQTFELKTFKNNMLWLWQCQNSEFHHVFVPKPFSMAVLPFQVSVGKKTHHTVHRSVPPLIFLESKISLKLNRAQYIVFICKVPLSQNPITLKYSKKCCQCAFLAVIYLGAQSMFIVLSDGKHL